jgi:hypothetical protein
MQKAFGNLQDTSGNAVGSATLTVYDAGTTDLSSIYSDNGVTPESNPFTIETDGEWSFYAADGEYDLQFVKTGYATQTFDDLSLFDRASVITALAGVTGFKFIQSSTPSASAADEWWLDTDDGKIYKSTAAGSGSWVLQYQNVLNSASEPVIINSTLTVSGDAAFDTDTLFVDVSEGCVGVGTITPGYVGSAGSTSLSVLGNTTHGALELVNKDATGVEQLGVVEFLNLDGGASITARSLIAASRDGADDASNLEFWTEPSGGGTTQHMIIESIGNVVIGASTALGKLHIDQSSATGAQPVLYLDQADISEEMIEFNTTIGVGNAIEAVGGKTLTTTHFIKITLPGALTRYIPCGTIA